MVYGNYSFVVQSNDQQVVPYNIGLPIFCNYIHSEIVKGHVASHWHTDYELVCVLDGAIQYTVDGADYELTAGNGIAIAPGHLHNAELAGEFAYVVLILSPEAWCGDASLRARYLEASIPSCRALCQSKPEEKAALEKIAEIARLRQEVPQGFELRIKALLYEMLGDLCQTEPKRVAQQQGLEILKQMLTYVQENLCEPVTLAEIAAAGAVSESTCCRLFRSFMKATPMSYVLELRLQAAESLLKSTGRPIAEIAMDCGFSTPSYFTEQFRRFRGVSPRDYRKQARSEL